MYQFHTLYPTNRYVHHYCTHFRLKPPAFASHDASTRHTKWSVKSNEIANPAIPMGWLGFRSKFKDDTSEDYGLSLLTSLTTKVSSVVSLDFLRGRSLSASLSAWMLFITMLTWSPMTPRIIWAMMDSTVSLAFSSLREAAACSEPNK